MCGFGQQCKCKSDSIVRVIDVCGTLVTAEDVSAIVRENIDLRAENDILRKALREDKRLFNDYMH